ncbi:phage holin family protein [Egicoccus sp. AB-alg2]|uniref:phage holin family protein n=1 Tax=Egicoccus sp. AB-alg2 TaxID=3242693 RepID=UPI00359EF67E
MVRLLVSAAVRVAANALGLLVAAWLLEGVTVSGAAFAVAVVVFTLAQVIVAPMLQNLAERNVAALTGGTALIATLLALIVTSLVSDGLRVDGLSNWLLATLVVWLVSVAAGLVLPLVFVKNRIEERRS